MTPVHWQRIEGAGMALAGLAGGMALAQAQHWPWWAIAAVLLAPDLSMVGDVAGRRIGAAIYNLAHLYALGLLLAAAALAIPGWADAAVAGLVWVGHIGIDRAHGYGLKQASGFRDTHLGRIGR